MHNRKFKTHHIILSIVFLIVAILNILLIISPSAIFPDASWGFQVLRSMEAGGNFNMLTKPSQQNIALNTTEFISWWSPGQYLVPYFFKLILGLNAGKAASVTTIFCQFTGLAGWYVLFKKAGFSKLISALSLLVIICQQAFFTPYIFYFGGETLFFAFGGWFLYGCITIKKTDWKLLLFVLFSVWVGFICKSSFIWVYAAGLLFIWIKLSDSSRDIKKWILNGVWIGIPALIAVITIYVSYLSKGLNPSSESLGLDFSLKTFLFPIASPITSGFSVDDLVNGLIFNNDKPILTPAWAIVILALLAILSIILIIAIYKHTPDKNYRYILLVVYVTGVLFFSVAFMRQLDISYEARHFRIIGLLIIPGTLYLFSTCKRAYKMLLALFIGVIAFFTVRFYTTGYYGLQHYVAYGTSGIGQQFIDQQSINYIKLLDSENKNAVFVFLSPDLGLEIKHNRIITLEEPVDEGNFNNYLYKGYSGPIFILLPAYYERKNATILLKLFPGYKNFIRKNISDYYVLYIATESR